MSAAAPAPGKLPQDLGMGLVMRRSSAADANALAEFNKMIHRDPGVTEPDEGVAAWTRELLSGNHPTFGVGDFTIVEETSTGQIVSSCNLISQTWTYAGIPFGVGRVELVGSAREWRNRGLVRRQFDVLHAWSAERGELAQAITGVPFFYRQFGYEMALSLGGSRACATDAVPKLKAGEGEPYVLRPAGEADIRFLVDLDAAAAGRSLVYCPRDERLWRHELTGRHERNVDRLDWWIVETEDARPVGAMGCAPRLWGRRFGVVYLELAPGESWLAVAGSVLRGALERGEAAAAQENKPLSAIVLALGIEHPMCQAARDRLPVEGRPYAWYMRVPDLCSLVRRIAPALEARLAASIASRHTGELKLSFFRSGLRLTFEEGRLVSVDPWRPEPTGEDAGHAAFPAMTFLQLLFGFRSLEQLRSAYPDCWVGGDEARVLLETLFPRRPSHVWAMY